MNQDIKNKIPVVARIIRKTFIVFLKKDFLSLAFAVLFLI